VTIRDPRRRIAIVIENVYNLTDTLDKCKIQAVERPGEHVMTIDPVACAACTTVRRTPRRGRVIRSSARLESGCADAG